MAPVPSTFGPAWVFDDSPIDDPFGYGERAVRWLRMLRHPKSHLPRQAFQLDRWQERIVRRIYGPRHPDGTRIVRNVGMLVPRGNRKTTFAAALALLHTIGPERVRGGEVLSAAGDKKQARIAYKEAVDIVAMDPQAVSYTRTTDFKNRLSCPDVGSFYEAISADASTQHGRTPSFVLADEIHIWPKRDLWEALRSALPKTRGALLVVTTTAGRGQENIAFEFIDYCRKVASGAIDDPATLPILFEAPSDCDWRDEAVWRAVNPGLSAGPPYPDIDGLRQLAREATLRVGERDMFRQYNLNIWLDHSADPFVDMAIYDEGAGAIDLDSLAASNEPCWLGVDLSSNGDLTVVVAAWRDGEDGYIVHPWFFCPKDNLRLRADRDGVPYPTWAEDGFITPTPGNVVDFRAVEDTIRDLCERFAVQEIAFDPHLARNMLNNLLEAGLPAVEMRQNWATMAPAVKELERAIVGRRFAHGGHPVLRWCFDNIAIGTDSAGNRHFHKGKSRDRIDGAVAAAMAVARAAATGGASVYDHPDWSPEWMVA